WLPWTATCSHRFIAKVVLPMDGRAATTTMSDGCRPEVILSSSSKPVDRPVTALLLRYSSSMRSTVLFSSALMSRGPLPFFCCSAISYVGLSLLFIIYRLVSLFHRQLKWLV